MLAHELGNEQASEDNDLTSAFKAILAATPHIKTEILNINVRDLALSKDLTPPRTKPGTVRARVSPIITLSIDDSPTLALRDIRSNSLSELSAQLTSKVALCTPLQVTVQGFWAIFHGELIVDEAVHAKLEYFLHWGSYDDLSSPWRTERLKIQAQGRHSLRIHHRVRVHRRGSYGATIFAQHSNGGSPYWLGRPHLDDAKFHTYSEPIDLRFRINDRIKNERAEAAQRLISSLTSFDEMNECCRSIKSHLPNIGIGALLAEITRDADPCQKLRALYERLSPNGYEAKSYLKTFGIGESVFVTPEGPHAGAGGLAQVITGLLPELAKADMPATFISPLYDQHSGTRHLSARATLRRGIKIGDRILHPHLVGEVSVHLGPTYNEGTLSVRRQPTSIPLRVYCAEFGGLRIFLLHNPNVFDSLYRSVYADEQLRRAIILSRGALEVIATEHFGIRPTALISNDWMTGFVPGLLAIDRRYKQIPWLTDTATVHILHNAGRDYQGRLPTCWGGQDLWPMISLPTEHFFGFQDPSSSSFFNPTAAALRHITGAILTVSHRYAQELVDGWYHTGLEDLFRSRHDKVFGISNGICRAEVDAYFANTTDIDGSQNSLETLLSQKKAAKATLQERYHLRRDPDAIVLSFVGRLAEQKGLQLLHGWCNDHISTLEGVLLRIPKCQILVAGPTTPDDESVSTFCNMMYDLQIRYPGRVSTYYEFVSHSAALKIMLGSDFFLMPSRFEPGGITQLEAQAAGALVIGRGVGGIVATVENYNPHENRGTGFLCYDYSPEAFRNTILWAIEVANCPMSRHAIIKQAHQACHDWKDRVPFYRTLLHHLALQRISKRNIENGLLDPLMDTSLLSAIKVV